MASAATYTTAAPQIITAMALLTRINVLQSGFAMISSDSRTDPRLARCVIGIEVTVMTTLWCLAVKAIFVVAGITGCYAVGIGRVTRHSVLPGYPVGDLAAVRSEMAAVATDPTAAASIIAAMTGCTAFNISRSL